MYRFVCVLQLKMIRISRILLSVVLVSTAVVSVAVDWNTTHIFNPEWHPHAKFHDVVMLWLLSGMSIMALWLLWRRSTEPDIAYLVAMLVPVVFWSPFFFHNARDSWNQSASRPERSATDSSGHSHLPQCGSCNSERDFGIDWLFFISRVSLGSGVGD
jgi:hypothetical protein